MHSKRGEPSLHRWPDKQISGNVSATLQHFYFDQQSEKTLQAFPKLELFNFFDDWSITDVKLFFESPTQWRRGRWFSGAIRRGPAVFLDLGALAQLSFFCQSNQAQKVL